MTFRTKCLFIVVVTVICAIQGFAQDPTFTPAEGYAGLEHTSTSMVFASGGVSQVSIHNDYSGTLSTVETYATTQLQAAIAWATGATPAINPGTPASIEIHLGLESMFSPGIVGETDEQAYYIYVNGDQQIDIMGNSPEAVLWAVIAFARDTLKVTWPVADDSITLVGSQQSTFDIDSQLDKPDFVQRGWIIPGPGGYDEEVVNWMSRTRQNVVITFAALMPTWINDRKIKRGIKTDTTIHSFWWLVPADEYYDNHDEYFPEINGVRVEPPPYGSAGVQLCLSNSDVLQIVIDKAKDTFNNYPEVDVFGVCQNDGGTGWCECNDCKDMDGVQKGTGNYSNRMVTFANLVADKIKTTHPDKLIGIYAYGTTTVPPTISVADNIAVTFCPIGRNYMKKLTDVTDATNASYMTNLNGWLNKSDHVRFWEYYFHPDVDKFPLFYSRTICAEFAELYALGLEGICSQSGATYWPGRGLFGYVFSRLSWDTLLTYETLLDDFCSERYGPGALAMELYHRTYEDTVYADMSKWKFDTPTAQYAPALFSSSEIATLEGHLVAAASVVAASGTSYHISAVAAERAVFENLKMLVTGPATISGIGSNLVSNPGAESGDAYWDDNIRLGNYSLSKPTGNARSGSKSFEITCTGNIGHAYWSQTVSGLTVGEKYAFRVWVRTTNTSNAVGHFSINYGSTETVLMIFTETNGDWMMMVSDFVAATTTCDLRLNSYGQAGTVQFDDVFLAKRP